jgi:phospholipid/cholesterol/gamma-HCH transport system permease protein
MSHQPAAFTLHRNDPTQNTLELSGDWVGGSLPANLPRSDQELFSTAADSLTINGSELGQWDSALMAFLLRCHDSCQQRNIEFTSTDMPDGVEKLLSLATSVKPHQQPEQGPASLFQALNPFELIRDFSDKLKTSLAFVGDVAIALGKLCRGKANTRAVDFWQFCFQAGPDAFAIISLTSVLVGMILGYLGAVQLRQFGAEIYVADLVAVGMLREMGVLMTAIVMAGRTGAAYAAQLGTMQTNEEIDAITTMGISPIEFLVVPRMLALIAVMPLLTIYADVLGIIGGGIVAAGMGISPTQYLNEAQTVISFTHINVGLLKSVIFATLIAIAGCRAGITSGRSSAAVGQAATKAVVTAIVYLIIADASINILFQQLDL